MTGQQHKPILTPSTLPEGLIDQLKVP